MAIEIIEREAWGARPARKTSRIPLPSRELWLHHTVGEYDGASGMKRLQAFHQDRRGFRDVGYSLVVDRKTLKIYEGAGIGILGAHTAGHNLIGHGIGVTGNFSLTRPPQALLELLAGLVAHGHKKGWWPNQFTGGHRDTKSTECPGDHLYAKIPTINALAQSGGSTVPDRSQLIAAAQQRLVDLGYDIGKFGPNGNGVDGDWGPASDAADRLRFDDMRQLATQIADLEALVQELQAGDPISDKYGQNLEAIQLHLKEFWDYTGPVDRLFGDGTMEAFARMAKVADQADDRARIVRAAMEGDDNTLRTLNAALEGLL